MPSLAPSPIATPLPALGNFSIYKLSYLVQNWPALQIKKFNESPLLSKSFATEYKLV